jgi:hypothetical protein
MPLKYKVGDTIMGRTMRERGQQGSVVAILKEGKSSKYQVRWSTGTESTLTARSISYPAQFAALSAASPASSGGSLFYHFLKI